MRKWLDGFLGSLLALALVGLVLCFYSVSRPNLWLVPALSLAFYGVLALFPRIRVEERFGLTLLFGSGSAILWLISGTGLTSARWHTIATVVTPLLAVPFVIGIAMAIRSRRAHTQERSRLGYVLVLIASGWLISYVSSSHGGASPMVDWLIHVTGLDRSAAETLIVAARKTGHFCFYGFVSIIGFIGARRNAASLRVALAVGLLSACAFATFDETRQSTEPDRGGSARDVLLDMTGAATAMAVAGAIARRRNADRPKPAENSSKL